MSKRPNGNEQRTRVDPSRGKYGAQVRTLVFLIVELPDWEMPNSCFSAATNVSIGGYHFRSMS